MPSLIIFIRSLVLSSLILIAAVFKSYCQTIPTGSYLEELSRRQQVIGDDTNRASFELRPLNAPGLDANLQSMAASKTYGGFNFMGVSSGFKILPVALLNEYNTTRPYGYNNGSLYPNAGYQTMFSAGFSLRAGILNVQVKPELVYAQNKYFASFADVQVDNSSPSLNSAYFAHVNGIDAPERFGNSSITHLYPGQSKITLSYKGMEAGISTENLWWGPGVRNSIMMSNSAPGFLHWTFNSAKPANTIIGSFEWQLIGGTLKQSGYPPTDIDKLTYGVGLYQPKPVVTRYLSAFTVNWQPKWLKGFYLGGTAYDYLDKDSTYHHDSFIHKILPVITNSSAKANAAATGDGQDFAYALNIRQLLPLYKAELYFEWARNDRSAGIGDFIEEPEHSSAYTFGGRKLFEISNGAFIQLKSEITNLQRATTFLVRDEPSWYEHSLSPRDGYTNDGRFVGAGIGPGSSSFILDLSYLKGLDSYGVTLERQLHNNDFYYEAFADSRIFSQHWVDVSSTFYANVKMKQYLVSAEITPVYSLNYEYKAGDSFNLHARVNLVYFFQ